MGKKPDLFTEAAQVLTGRSARLDAPALRRVISLLEMTPNRTIVGVVSPCATDSKLLGERAHTYVEALPWEHSRIDRDGLGRTVETDPRKGKIARTLRSAKGRLAGIESQRDLARDHSEYVEELQHVGPHADGPTTVHFAPHSGIRGRLDPHEVEQVSQLTTHRDMEPTTPRDVLREGEVKSVLVAVEFHKGSGKTHVVSASLVGGGRISPRVSFEKTRITPQGPRRKTRGKRGGRAHR